MVADRHGRAQRADNDARRRPPDGYRVRTAQRFRRVVEDAVALLPQRLAQPLTGAHLVIADVPPQPSPGGDIPLASFERGRLTVYRRPVEIRAESRATLEETLVIAIGQAVARAMGYPDDLDDLFD